jgi:SAM-dependent methyltransferase
MVSARRAVTSRLRRLPGVGPLALAAKRAAERRRFPGSAAFWEAHYARGGDSGPGSRGNLAAYKADFVNAFVAEHGIRTVVDLGCGDGAQLALADYPSYVGLDVSETALDSCRRRFAGDPTKTFARYQPGAVGEGVADLALSMDVLFHLVEDDVFEAYLRDLFGAATRFVLVYASDGDRESTIGSVTDRPFTAYVAAHFPGWRLRDRVPNPHAWAGDVATGTRSDFFVYEPA